MILPTKHLPPSKAIIGVAGKLVGPLASKPTVTDLWERVRNDPDVGTFERFVLGLDLLYLLGVVDIMEGRLVRRR